ncbi:early nodulin 3 [Olea europaea subsp. europaea]|uniref:Early nodulin 3 n=1 Tax=Olea europaea subsp. europaea TaxID=158383 RepID=A0A8S0TZX1_OLEEU|nr:early nodulin 3 [Olea europaea subsp. europaea]
MASLKYIFLFFTVVFWLCVLFEAREFVIDEENNLWAVPSSVDEFNKWAEKTHFQIGDCLVLNGAEEQCQKGQKLEFMVLSDKHGSDHQSTVQAPSPHHTITTTMHRRKPRLTVVLI